MPIRTLLALLLLLPAAAPAQELDLALNAVVKISGTRNGQPVHGSGFVVKLEPRKATLVTAAQVLAGVRRFEVRFAADLTRSFFVEPLPRGEGEEPSGLALFEVHGSLPPGATTVALELGKWPSYDEELLVWSFPEPRPDLRGRPEPQPPVAQPRVLAGRRGNLLLLEGEAEKHFFGAALHQAGKVVGVITGTEESMTSAVDAATVQEALAGWGVEIGGSSAAPPKTVKRAPPPPPKATAATPPPPPAVSEAAGIDAALRAVVEISDAQGTSVLGTGLVFRLEPDNATIVTAGQVIKGMHRFKVTFAADLTKSFLAEPMLMSDEGGDDEEPYFSVYDLRFFKVHGSLPAGVSTLGFDTPDILVMPGEKVLLVGFPETSPDAQGRRKPGPPVTLPRISVGTPGAHRLLMLEGKTEKRFFGAPVLYGGKLLGVVTNSTDALGTFALDYSTVEHLSVHWGVVPSGGSMTPPRPKGVSETTSAAPPKVSEACRPGQERIVDDVVFVRICAGSFVMGTEVDDPHADEDEKPAHKVTLSEFWLAKYEESFEPWDTREAPLKHPGKLALSAWSWLRAKARCEELPGGRLPTEAEWEYAARAGGKTAWSHGANATGVGEHAWYVGNAKAGETRRLGEPHVVGQKKPNAWGLHDMAGNVSEWVADWYGPYSTEAQTDPTGPPSGEFKVLRGGSHRSWAWQVRPTYRYLGWPLESDDVIGFRCVIAPRREP